MPSSRLSFANLLVDIGFTSYSYISLTGKPFLWILKIKYINLFSLFLAYSTVSYNILFSLFKVRFYLDNYSIKALSSSLVSYIYLLLNINYYFFSKFSEFYKFYFVNSLKSSISVNVYLNLLYILSFSSFISSISYSHFLFKSTNDYLSILDVSNSIFIKNT
jgi:hypothetical protein